MSRDSPSADWVLAALAGSDLAAWVWDVRSERVELTESWGGILGGPRGAVTTSSPELATLVHPDDLPQVLATLTAAVRGDSDDYNIEHRVRTASGKYRWIQSRGKVIERATSGRALRLTGTNADITAQRNAEEMLAARELQLRLVTDHVPAMIVELDASDRIRYCNGKYAEYFGKATEILAGQPLREAVGDAAHERFNEIRPRLRAGEAVLYERSLVRPDRPEAQLQIQIVPRMHGERGYLGCYVMLQDVTERRRAEKMKEEFFNTVSHELRTPLHSIRASLEQIAGGGTDAPQLVATARASCERLVRLLNDILDYQRMRAGRALPGEQPRIDLAGQVREAVAASESLAREAGVEFRVTTPAVPILVPADADRVTQLVTNLAANALSYSPRGSAVLIDVVRRDGVARVSVRDHGPGVPEDFKQQLFRQFSQAQATGGSKRGGSGLGLAIAKAITEQLHGRIGFEPAEGGGAVFWFELPVP